jgi:hypothetical protein
MGIIVAVKGPYFWPISLKAGQVGRDGSMVWVSSLT